MIEAFSRRRSVWKPLGPVVVPGPLAVLKRRYLWLEDAPGAGWAPFHAVELLGDSKAPEAVGAMLAVLKATGWNDLLHDAVIRVLPGLGAPVLEPALAAYARAHDDEDFRHGVTAVLSELGVRDDRVLALLLEQLRAAPTRAGNLANYHDPKALKHLAQAFDAFELEQTTSPLASQALVELRDAIEQLGGGLTAAQEAKSAKGMVAGDQWWRKLTEATRMVERVPQEKLGRNDRCWCGSGKKFKKCHPGQEAL